MQRRQSSKIPWAIALLIVLFACVVAFLGSRIIAGIAQKDPYKYATREIDSNLGLEGVRFREITQGRGFRL